MSPGLEVGRRGHTDRRARFVLYSLLAEAGTGAAARNAIGTPALHVANLLTTSQEDRSSGAVVGPYRQGLLHPVSRG